MPEREICHKESITEKVFKQRPRGDISVRGSIFNEKKQYVERLWVELLREHQKSQCVLSRVNET